MHEVELHHLRLEFPLGTVCWYCDAGNPPRTKQTWITGWLWRDGAAQAVLAARLTVPSDRILFDESAAQRSSNATSETQAQGLQHP